MNEQVEETKQEARGSIPMEPHNEDGLTREFASATPPPPGSRRRWLKFAITAMVMVIVGVATWVRVVQVVGVGLLFVPITLAAYIGLPPEKSNSVAGIINFMRNIGSSIGTSMVTTLIARRAQLHQVHLVSRIAADNPMFARQVTALTQRLARLGLGPYDAQRQAYARMYDTVNSQAHTLAYIDAFWILTAIAAVMFCLSFLLRKNEPGASGDMPVG